RQRHGLGRLRARLPLCDCPVPVWRPPGLRDRRTHAGGRLGPRSGRLPAAVERCPGTDRPRVALVRRGPAQDRARPAAPLASFRQRDNMAGQPPGPVPAMSDIRNDISRDEAEQAVRTLLRWSGEDPTREGLLDTPRRVVNAYQEWFSGYALDPDEYLARTFEEVCGYDEMI